MDERRAHLTGSDLDFCPVARRGAWSESFRCKRRVAKFSGVSHQDSWKILGGTTSLPGIHKRLVVKLLRAHGGCLGARRR
jgi:hypothetical protein